jgi:glycoprotein 2-beta-D-xylosyltransferase
MQFFNHSAYDTNILLIDAHPHGSLDSTWTHLFNSTVRLSALPPRTLFKHLIWGILGYNSLMTSYLLGYPPLYEEFREFFLSSFNVSTSRTLDCSHLTIRFIWRHDYVAHPRNPTGSVSRQISNEQELVRYVQLHNPTAHVSGIQIDQFEMRRQLQYIVDTDVLIGMHGAGLTHALFLPKSSAIIELVPNYWSASSEHFEAISAWRNLVYERWVNNDPHSEVPNQSTSIPPRVAGVLIKNVVRRICAGFVDAKEQWQSASLGMPAGQLLDN